jgi:hypothetical protein
VRVYASLRLFPSELYVFYELVSLTVRVSDRNVRSIEVPFGRFFIRRKWREFVHLK